MTDGQEFSYFTSVFVSLGVFLFGYDQGVMSGIITSVTFLDPLDQSPSTPLLKGSNNLTDHEQGMVLPRLF